MQTIHLIVVSFTQYLHNTYVCTSFRNCNKMDAKLQNLLKGEGVMLTPLSVTLESVGVFLVSWGPYLIQSNAFIRSNNENSVVEIFGQKPLLGVCSVWGGGAQKKHHISREEKKKLERKKKQLLNKGHAHHSVLFWGKEKQIDCLIHTCSQRGEKKIDAEI